MNDNDAQNPDLVKNLRETIDRISAERDEAKQQARSYVLKDSFSTFGLDPDKGPGKFAAQAYDGDLDPEAVGGWLAENGFAPQGEPAPEQPAGLEQRQQQRQNLDRIDRDGAAPDTKPVSKDEMSKLLKANPQEALRVARERGVEFTHANT